MKDPIKFLTAISIIVAFDAIVYALIFLEIPESNKELFIHLIGIIEGAFVGSLVGHYWSRNYKDKVGENI